MGDFKAGGDEDTLAAVARTISHTQPLGMPQPPNEPHSVSASLPTWAAVCAFMAREDWVKIKMETNYPRFGICPYVGALGETVMERLNHPPGMKCRIFTSKDAARRFSRTLKDKDPESTTHIIRFLLPRGISPMVSKWGCFVAVLYCERLETDAFLFWMTFGDGISNRHAQFCLSLVPFMNSEPDPADSTFQTSAPRSDIGSLPLPNWTSSSPEEKDFIKSVLAETTASQKPDMKPIAIEDVFLYPTGMRAISAIARALRGNAEDTEAVIYGWLYSGTAPCVKGSGYSRFTLYGHGTDDELNHLESSLAAGRRITVLFCEINSNPQLHTPDLHRIRWLADRYNFIVVIDNTIGTSINTDVLPYADVIMTSLTKIFSGGCNVMGGSLIVNPNSKQHEMIRACLQDSYEDLYFPLDTQILARNCSDYPERVRRCSESALEIANLLAAHPSVDYVNYPTMVPTRSLYERYRRQGEGYGHLLSVIFRKPESAVQFYDSLDVWKGPSIGTNCSIAIPYSVLAHWREQDMAAAYGVPKHIVRLSVGLEPLEELRDRVARALDLTE